MVWDNRYRMLDEGEVILEGDEVLTDSHLGWQPAGITVGQTAPNPYYTAHRIYRRIDDGLAEFSEWFRKNFPGPDTIIHKPDWHAPKIYRAARHAYRSARALNHKEQK